MPEEAKYGRGRCCVFGLENIDTDVIIPQTELVTVSKSGLADGLFARWRYKNDRIPNPDFVLNRPRNKECRFLLAAANFGCGSSREHAAWALTEYGVRAVISPNFGEIFFRNSIRNGLLPARIAAADYRCLASLADGEGGIDDMIVDLTAGQITVGRLTVPFSLDQVDRMRLLTDTDDIAETLLHRTDIEGFVAADRIRRPWVHQTLWEG